MTKLHLPRTADGPGSPPQGVSSRDLSNPRTRVVVQWALHCLCAVWLLATVTGMRGDDFEIVVRVAGGEKKEPQSASSLHLISNRPATRLRAQKTFEVSWVARNPQGKAGFKNLLIHFFIFREARAGQTEIPKLGDHAVYEGALTTDFAPGEKASWRFVTALREPGPYLLRVETLGMKQALGHEARADLELKVN